MANPKILTFDQAWMSFSPMYQKLLDFRTCKTDDTVQRVTMDENGHIISQMNPQDYFDECVCRALRWRARLLALLLMHERLGNPGFFIRLWEDAKPKAHILSWLRSSDTFKKDQENPALYEIEKLLALLETDPDTPEAEVSLIETITQKLFCYILNNIDDLFQTPDDEPDLIRAITNVAYTNRAIWPLLRSVARNVKNFPLALSFDDSFSGKTITTTLPIKKTFEDEFKDAKHLLGNIILAPDGGLKTDDAARILNVGPAMVRKLVNQGVLDADRPKAARSMIVNPTYIWREWQFRILSRDASSEKYVYGYYTICDLLAKYIVAYTDWSPIPEGATPTALLLDYPKGPISA